VSTLLDKQLSNGQGLSYPKATILRFAEVAVAGIVRVALGLWQIFYAQECYGFTIMLLGSIPTMRVLKYHASRVFALLRCCYKRCRNTEGHALNPGWRHTHRMMSHSPTLKVTLSIPDFAAIMGLIGSTCCMLLALMMPGLIHVIFSGFDGTLHSRMPLSSTPLLGLKLCYACDQWHSSRVVTFLPVDTLNFTTTLKARLYKSQLSAASSFLDHVLVVVGAVGCLLGTSDALSRIMYPENHTDDAM
jgi:hypothetical protein